MRTTCCVGRRGGSGLPIGIYRFSNDIAWCNREATQADMFDHPIAMLPPRRSATRRIRRHTKDGKIYGNAL